MIGPVGDPLYIVSLYPEMREKISKGTVDSKSFIGTKAYFILKTKKLVFWHNLMKHKGSDASNVYDEEIPESE